MISDLHAIGCLFINLIYNFIILGVADPSAEVADGTSEATYVAMQPQESHVEETITSMDASDDVRKCVLKFINDVIFKNITFISTWKGKVWITQK